MAEENLKKLEAMRDRANIDLHRATAAYHWACAKLAEARAAKAVLNAKRRAL